MYKEMFQKHELQPTPVTLRTYMGELVVPEGKLRVQVKHKKQKVKLDLYAIKGGRQVLFGRDLFGEIKLDWGEIHSPKSYDGTSKDISPKDANKQLTSVASRQHGIGNCVGY